MTARRWLFGFLSLGAVLYFGHRVASFALPMDRVPFDKWSTGIGPRLVTTWWFLGTFVLAALSFGQLLVRKASKGPRDGSWALAFSSGAIVFAAAIGLFGWMGLLAFPFFWVLPLTMTLVGLPWLRDAVVETRTQWAREPAFSGLEMAALLFAGCCFGLLLLQVIAPDNINYDAMWYHLRAAERNALVNGIERTPEGDLLLTLPSATSWLYTWAFLAPALSLEEKVVLAQHLELSIFVGTLACLPPLVRALVPGRARQASRLTWVALFFFPSVFIYDTGLMAGGDHLVAFWAIASVLAWVQVRERDDAASWALLGLQLAGLSAKYTSIYLVVPLVPMMLADALWRGRALRPALRLQGLFVAAGVTLLLTAPYWLRNWVWHHNPLYPAASSIFPSTPWHADADVWQASFAVDNIFAAAVSSPMHRVRATLNALVDYHQVFYGWKDMQGDQPVMGSGYFLSLVVLPFLPERRRLLALAVLLNVGIMVWFNTYQHHMRYLMVLTPLMAAGMAATAISVWELGWPGRAAVLGVTGLLLAAYADVPFRRTHRTNRASSPVENAAEYINKRGPGSARLKMWSEIGATLPPAAKVIVHGMDPLLGFPRLTVTDCYALQFGINYGRWGSVGEVWRNLRELGVTHLIWKGEVEQPDSVTGEALFLALAQATVNRKAMHGYQIGELPAFAPDAPGTHIMYVGCNGQWRTGIYPLATLAAPLPPLWNPWPELTPHEPLTLETWGAAVTDPRLGWVVLEESCKLPSPAGYVLMSTQVAPMPSKLRYFVRQR